VACGLRRTGGGKDIAQIDASWTLVHAMTRFVTTRVFALSHHQQTTVRLKLEPHTNATSQPRPRRKRLKAATHTISLINSPHRHFFAYLNCKYLSKLSSRSRTPPILRGHLLTMCTWMERKVKAGKCKTMPRHTHTETEIVERCSNSPGPGKMCDKPEQVKSEDLTITKAGEDCDQCN